MIAFEGASKRYAGRVVVLPTTLTVATGSCLALLGPSGCGKSTLLRMVLGLIAPDEGRVFVGEVRVTLATALSVRRRSGYVIQEGGLFPHLSAERNVSLLAGRLGWKARRMAERIAELTDLVRLEPSLLKRYPSELSGGQRQRVGIMRALMLDPQFLVLDEPMGALDPLVRAALQDDLKRIFSRLGKTVLLVTHDLDEAGFLGDEVALMGAGVVVQKGALRTLIERPENSFVRAFVAAQSGRSR